MTALVVAVVFLGLLAAATALALPVLRRRGGVLDQHSSGRAAGHRASVAALARQRGWSVTVPESPVGFPASLRAEQVAPQECALVVEGGADRFVAQSWDVRVRNVGGVVGGSARQHLLRVPTSSDVQLMLRPFPRPGAPMLMPGVFQGRVLASGGPAGFLTAGDWTRASATLAPLVPIISAQEWWVIVDDRHVTITSHVEPDAEELLARLDVARDVAAALEA